MESGKEKIKALVLFSGGLDSLLAAKILAEQGIEVVPVFFESYFFGAGKAQKAAAEIGLELRIEDISEEQLAIVRKPRHGWGSAANPCIDCHLLMLKSAKAIADREGFDIIATGEVLEERPMSQNRRSLDLVRREAGLVDKLLRPLSAKLLEETEAEIKGLVDREKLRGISGRSRKPQLELAKKFDIKNIPQPAGGCILTEKDFAEKLRRLLDMAREIDGNDIKLLLAGRVSWEEQMLVVVARNERECASLKTLFRTGDALLEPDNFSGPTVLLRSYGEKTACAKMEVVGREFVKKYSKKYPQNARVAFTCTT